MCSTSLSHTDTFHSSENRATSHTASLNQNDERLHSRASQASTATRMSATTFRDKTTETVNSAKAGVVGDTIHVKHSSEKKVMPLWANIVKIGLFVSLASYMMYTQQNLNFFLLCGRFVQLVLLPLIALREGGIYLTSVEYNIRTHAILAVVIYSIALYILSMSSNHLGRLVMEVTKTTAFPRSKEYFALGLVSGFKLADKTYFDFYCNNPTVDWQISYVDQIENAISLPLLLMLMFVFQYDSDKSVSATMDSNSYVSHHSSLLLLKAYILYKWIRSIKEYQKASSLTTSSLATQTAFTAYHSNPQSLDQRTQAVAASKMNVWRIYGHLYDMNDYVQHHPGGVEAIMLGANRDDCTALFQSYHAFTIHKAKAVLEKYRVLDSTLTGIRASVSSTDIPDPGLLSSQHENDPFYDILCQRVRKVLLEAGIDPVNDRAGTWFRWAYYTFILVGVTTSCYYHCSGYLLGSFMLGLWGLHMGASIGHDGGHFAVSRIPLVNDIAVWGTAMIANPIIWQHQHTYAHHSYTNDDDHDPDLHHAHPFYRMSFSVPLRPAYRHQIHVIYILAAYTLTNFGTCYWYSLRFIFERSLHGVVDWSDRKRIGRSFLLWLHVVSYSTINVIAPFFAHESSWIAFLAGIIPIAVCGFYFAMVSQVGHITEFCKKQQQQLRANRDRINNNVKLETSLQSSATCHRHRIAQQSWAADQIETTNDFCPQSTFHFYVGAHLGLQIEHHLFPGLNHQHLHIIQPVVEQTCREYNVDYKVYDSYSAVFWDQIRYLQKLAEDQEHYDKHNSFYNGKKES